MTPDVWHDPACQAVSYLPRQPCAYDGARYTVVYRAVGRRELERHAACFTHGMEEAERSYRAATISTAELEGPHRA